MSIHAHPNAWLFCSRNFQRISFNLIFKDKFKSKLFRAEGTCSKNCLNEKVKWHLVFNAPRRIWRCQMIRIARIIRNFPSGIFRVPGRLKESIDGSYRPLRHLNCKTKVQQNPGLPKYSFELFDEDKRAVVRKTRTGSSNMKYNIFTGIWYIFLLWEKLAKLPSHSRYRALIRLCIHSR